MAEITIAIPGFKCERCGHEWVGRRPRGRPDITAPPRKCPHCKSAWWDTPRPQPAAGGQACG